MTTVPAAHGPQKVALTVDARAFFTKLKGAVLLPVALGLLQTGCGSQSSSAKQVATDTSPTHPLIVVNPSGNPDAYYVPNPIHVHAGQFITWTNRDGDPHDVTAYSGYFASGPIPAGGTWRWVLTRPGSYTYFCTLHPEMKGKIIVTK